MEKKDRKKYYLILKETREEIRKLLHNEKDFAEIVCAEFTLKHFHNPDVAVKQKINELSENLDENLDEILKNIKVLKPKFGRMIQCFQRFQTYNVLEKPINKFYELVEIYYTAYEDLIHKVIHNNQYSYLFKHEELFSEAFLEIPKTLAYYDINKGEFGTLLGNNIYLMMHEQLREQNKHLHASDESLKYVSSTNQMSKNEECEKNIYQVLKHYHEKNWLSSKHIKVFEALYNSSSITNVSEKYSIPADEINVIRKDIAKLLQKDKSFSGLIKNYQRTQRKKYEQKAVVNYYQPELF